jgi:prepilin-type N-terminal cleavage/methylation domain-containing protein
MRKTIMRRQTYSPVRAGFTLIELLVVIAIIALLVGLLSAAAFRLIGSQQYANTVTGLKTFNTKAATQWRAVTDDANKSSPAFDAWSSANAGGRQGYIQARQKQAFPTTFDEALNPGNGLAPWPAYKVYLNGLGISSSTGLQSIEGSVCLLMILTTGPFNSGSDADSFGQANVGTMTVGSVTAKGIIDGYQKPLAVTRTATGLVLASTIPDGTQVISTNLP